MIPTCSAQTPIDKTSRTCRSNLPAFTLTELVVVIVIISLTILLAGTNLSGLLAKTTFKGQIQEIVSAMQMAANSAAETGKKYEAIFDLDEQSFLLREITTQDLANVLEEEIIIANELTERCRIGYVIFDDGDFTNQSRAKFRVGKAGWQFGGKIVLLDSSERPYSIIVNRLNRNIALREGDVRILMPKSSEEMQF